VVKKDLKFKSVDIMTFEENKTILFEHGSAKLSRSDIAFIKKISIKAIETNSIVRVTGHASMRTRDMDAFKHALANFNISLKRANIVAQALMKNGVSAENLIVDAVGANDPVETESMPSGERANRRAEISLEAS
jgi:outer membrane protein OmpA-like peptidoglycan-associated protein